MLLECGYSRTRKCHGNPDDQQYDWTAHPQLLRWSWCSRTRFDVNALLFGPRLRHPNRDCQDAPSIGDGNVVLVGPGRKRHRPHQRAVGELGMPLGFVPGAALSLDRQHSITSVDIYIFSWVDAG